MQVGSFMTLDVPRSVIAVESRDEGEVVPSSVSVGVDSEADPGRSGGGGIAGVAEAELVDGADRLADEVAVLHIHARVLIERVHGPGTSLVSLSSVATPYFVTLQTP